MAVNLSVKNVPDELADKLRRRAKANNRSLQGEMLAVLQAAVQSDRKLSAGDLLQQVRAAGLQTPREAAAEIRNARDAR